MKFDHTLGESFYQPRLKAIVDELMQRGHRRRDPRAPRPFSPTAPSRPRTIPSSSTRRASGFPIRSSFRRGGGFNYASTDLATLAYRIETWQAEEIIYVTDGRQQLHFRQLFACFRRWHPESQARLAHVWFGSILGEDGSLSKPAPAKPSAWPNCSMKPRNAPSSVVSEKSPELPEADRREIARVVGICAVKYADLLAQPPKRLRVQLGQAAGVQRQHRPVSAIRLRPHPQHLPQEAALET